MATPDRAMRPIPHSSLARLKPGERVGGFYHLQRQRCRRRRDGALFWELLLVDGSGELTAYAWPEQLALNAPLPASCVYVEFRTRRQAQQLVADLQSLDTEPFPIRKST